MAGEVAKNGTQQLQRPMPESRRKKVEAGLSALHELEHERDELRRLLDAEEAKCKLLSSELDGLRLAYSRQQTETDTYRVRRDDAVEDLAKFRATFEAVRVIMNRHGGEDGDAHADDAGGAGHSG